MFNFGKFHKAWRKGKPAPSLKVYAFEEDTKICVIATLEECFKRTKFCRGKNKKELLVRLKQSDFFSQWTGGKVKTQLEKHGMNNFKVYR